TFVFMKTLALFHQRDVLLQKTRLKSAGRLQRAGWVFGAASLLLFAGFAHSAVWRYHDIRADHPRFAISDMLLNRGYATYAPPEYIGWQYDSTYRMEIPPDARRNIDTAIHHYEAGDAWGLLPSPDNRVRLAWLYAATNQRERAAQAMRDIRGMVGDIPRYQLTLAKAETAAGHTAAARAAFESAIAQEKSARDALVRKTDITHHPLASEIWLEWGLFQAFRLNDEAGARAAWQAAARFDCPQVAESATALTHRRRPVLVTALSRG